MVMPREVESFWRKVDKSGECWLWTGARHSTGYGSFTIAGRQQLAHRVAYFASHGAVPDGLEIDHSCRNKRCVRPDHLRLATHKQNMENRDLDSNNTSGYRGVHWRSDKGKWVASVHHNGRNRHLGVFDSAEAAGRCAKQARLALFTHNDADRSHDLAG